MAREAKENLARWTSDYEAAMTGEPAQESIELEEEDIARLILQHAGK
jgi:hypothetical protein